jgi:hypothetical protein
MLTRQHRCAVQEYPYCSHEVLYRMSVMFGVNARRAGKDQ